MLRLAAKSVRCIELDIRGRQTAANNNSARSKTVSVSSFLTFAPTGAFDV